MYTTSSVRVLPAEGTWCNLESKVTRLAIVHLLASGLGFRVANPIGIMEKKMETTIMENQMEKKMENEMETGIIQVANPKPYIRVIYWGYILELYWGYIGIMEKKMETTI